jgi:hypothetical protein
VRAAARERTSLLLGRTFIPSSMRKRVITKVAAMWRVCRQTGKNCPCPG